MATINKSALHHEVADADALLEIRKSQAQIVARGFNLYRSLIAELMLLSGKPLMLDELETLLDQSNFEMESKVRRDKLNAIYMKIISLPARINAANNLSKMLAILIRTDSHLLTSKKSMFTVNQINESLSKMELRIRKNLDSILRPVYAEN